MKKKTESKRRVATGWRAVRLESRNYARPLIPPPLRKLLQVRECEDPPKTPHGGCPLPPVDGGPLQERERLLNLATKTVTYAT